ncbi:MAG: integrin, partial [Hydrogenophaga sp.]|nr:integrin [Hydrogenophaga sp.]
PQDNNAASASGAAYVLRRRGVEWHQSRYIKATNTESTDRFGDGIALSGDGQSLAVGSTSEDSAATGIGGDQNDNSGGGSGAVYLY